IRDGHVTGVQTCALPIYSSSPPASSPILSKNSQSGSLTSLQNDAMTGKTNWIIGGVYKMNNINTANPMFNATFYMMKTDGTAPQIGRASCRERISISVEE